MPPKKRDRRRLGARPYKNYTEEMLALAIEMVQKKKMSSYEAENVFGIPRRTIERKIKNLHMNKPGPPQKLSELEHLNFVKVLILASDFGAPLSLMDLRILVHEHLLKNNKTDLFNGNLLSEWRARNFIERHRDKLTVRAVQNIKKARAEKTVIEFIILTYKIENPRQVALNKSHFPPLLKKVIDDVNMSKKENVVSGFKATGIYPFNPQKVLSKVPEYTSNEQEYSVDKVLLDYLKEEPGKSVTKSDLQSKINKKKENEKNLKITTKSVEDCIEQEISSIDQVYGTLSNNEDLVIDYKQKTEK